MLEINRNKWYSYSYTIAVIEWYLNEQMLEMNRLKFEHIIKSERDEKEVHDSV